MAVLLAGPLPAVSAAGPFTLASPAFSDDGMLDAKTAGDDKANPACVGRNLSPPFVWSNVPEGTKSFAFLMSDIDGRVGLGVSHQVAYGLPLTLTSLKEGDLANAAKLFVAGKGTLGRDAYLGPCPPAGTGPHHYVFQVIATDLDAGALPAGLTREQVFEKLAGHTKAAASLIGRFGR